MKKALLLTLFCSGIAGAVMADDTLVLKNGEILKGTLVRVADGFYYFKSSTFGDLKVEADKVVPAPAAAKPAEPALPLDPSRAPLRAPSAPGGPPEEEGPPPPAPDQAFLHRILHLPPEFHVELNLGLEVISDS